jgi:hypothetical protein
VSWSVLQSNSANSTSGSTPGVAYTTANLSSGTVLICAVSCFNAKTNSVTDASANSFTKIGAVLLGGSESNGETSLWAIATPAGDVGAKPVITALLDNSSAGVGILIQEVSGILATADGTAGTSTAATGTNTSPSYSSTAAGEYLVAAGGDNGGPETMTQLGSGYTADAKNLNNNSAANILVDYKNSSGGSESDGWSSGVISAGFAGAVLVAFQLAGTLSGPNSPSTGTDLGGGTGSWSNPGNITADDGSAATWAVV